MEPLHLDSAEVADVIERLDRAGNRAVAEELRRSQRFEYRTRIARIDVLTGNNQWDRLQAPTRNISEQGVAVLLGKFVYPGAHCRVELTTSHSHRLQVDGVVRTCRYISGTRNIYEVGIQFSRPVDVALFNRTAESYKVLLVEDDPMMQKLTEHLLKGMTVDLQTVDNGAAALELLQTQVFDAVLLDIELPDISGIDVARRARAAGVFSPFIALSAHDRPEIQEEALAAGCGMFLTKPVNAEELQETIGAVKCEPVVSTLVGVPELGPLIDTFVSALTERVRELERAFASQDRQQLEQIARVLKGQGGGCGFEVITRLAGELESAVHRGIDFPQLRICLTELTSRCMAARPATAGRNA